MAFLAYHLHWPLAELMELPHRERRVVGRARCRRSTRPSTRPRKGHEMQRDTSMGACPR